MGPDGRNDGARGVILKLGAAKLQSWGVPGKIYDFQKPGGFSLNGGNSAETIPLDTSRYREISEYIRKNIFKIFTKQVDYCISVK